MTQYQSTRLAPPQARSKKATTGIGIENAHADNLEYQVNGGTTPDGTFRKGVLIPMMQFPQSPKRINAHHSGYVGTNAHLTPSSLEFL